MKILKENKFKKCPECKQVKNIENFVNGRKTCTKCREYMKEYYQTHASTYKKAVTNRRKLTAFAPKHYYRWTPEEVKILTQQTSITDLELSKIMHRSEHAIQIKRRKLNLWKHKHLN